MHSQLPCAASGGEDGVCKAITELSKELLDSNTTASQAGGCDSSDCLFCQYRSNSPFHLNAYASKLSSLLRKRSLNGMTLSSLNELIDASTEPGAAFLTSFSGIGKRQRVSSSNGFLHPASAPFAQADALPLTVVDHGVGSARSGPQPHQVDSHHDCGAMCGIGSCKGHTSDTASAAARQATEQSSPPDVASTLALTAADQLFAHTSTATKLFGPPPGLSALPPAQGHDVRLSVSLAESGQAGPGPSSLHLLQRLSHSRRHHHQPRQVAQRSGQDPREARGKDHGRSSQSRQGSSLPHVAAAGRALGEGWSFLPEWEGRPDPAPAELREVLRLPDRSPGGPTSGSRVDGQQRGEGPPGSCHRSAGIICALDFSPDGGLLAAGGVDKQIRLYNLSDVLGDLSADGGCNDDSDDNLLVWDFGLEPGRRHSDGRSKERDLGGNPRARRRGNGDNESDGDGEDGDWGAGGGSGGLLLAAVQRMPSKISSMAWSPFMDGVLTVGDYDGVLLQLHIASGHQLSDVDAHGGRKIWSVAHSCRIPHLVASAADDRCARLWAGRGLTEAVATLQPNPRASVCSVDFSAEHDHLVALACSDRTAYLYDMRRATDGPLTVLRHHSRPASYCRFMGSDRLVTAATDASIALWDIRGAVPGVADVLAPPTVTAASAAAQAKCPTLQRVSPFDVVQGYRPDLVSEPLAPPPTTSAFAPPQGTTSAAAAAAAPCRIFRGHRNEKNFVGLSVRPVDGLVACGSECSRAFVYHTSWSEPLATLQLPGCPGAGAAEPPGLQPHPAGSPAQGALRRSSSLGAGAGFVSAVCWQPEAAALLLGLPPLLASATSVGTVSLSVLARPQ